MKHILNDIIAFNILDFINELLFGIVKADQVVFLNLFAVLAGAVHFHDGAISALNSSFWPAFHS